MEVGRRDRAAHLTALRMPHGSERGELFQRLPVEAMCFWEQHLRGGGVGITERANAHDGAFALDGETHAGQSAEHPAE